MNSKERTLEDKITLTYFPEGGACIDLSKLGISLNDENTLFEWVDWMQHQTIKNSYERIIKLLEDEKLHDISFEPFVISLGVTAPEPIKTHSRFCQTCSVIALIKGEQQSKSVERRTKIENGEQL